MGEVVVGEGFACGEGSKVVGRYFDDVSVVVCKLVDGYGGEVIEVEVGGEAVGAGVHLREVECGSDGDIGVGAVASLFESVDDVGVPLGIVPTGRGDVEGRAVGLGVVAPDESVHVRTAL